MKIVFMGTPDFAAVILQALMDSEHEICGVATQPDKAKDRGKKIQLTPVKELAISHGIPVLQPERVRGNAAFLQTLADWQPDLCVVAAYGQILPKEVLELPKLGCINVHASLLPKLRGASPIQQAIVSGETETGVTIMQMAEGLDTGDMLAKVSLPIGSMNGGELHDALAEAGAKLLVATLPRLAAGDITPEPQDDSRASYAGMIRKQDGHIDFTKTPEEIERLIRGFSPWPGAFCEESGKVIKFWAAEPLDEKTDAAPGTVLEADDAGLRLSCGGRVLLVTELQVPGKKRTRVSDYLRGNRMEKGTVLA